MKHLYKYSTYRKNYFENPTLRITQRNSLNDPFESLPPAEEVQEFYENNLDEKIYLNEEEHVSSTANFDEFGIISLSQTFDNLLMWSHYSNQHSGFVMELDHRKIGLKNTVIHSSYLNNENELAKPIIYSNNRSVGCYKTNHKDAIFMKSEQWSYEKEYRIAAKLTSSSQIKIKQSAIDNSDGYINTHLKYFNIIPEENDYLSFSIKQDVSFPEEGLKETVLRIACHRLSKSSESLFLYQIPKEAITKIILGCKIDPEHEKEIISSVKNYAHPIQLFKATLHPDRFELKLAPIKI